MFQSLLSGIGLLSAIDAGSLGIAEIDRDFDFQHIDVVPVFREFLHAAADDLGLLLGELEPFLVPSAGVVSDELQEEGNIVGDALGADTLDPGMLAIVDRFLLEGSVVEQDLDGVGAHLLDAADRSIGQQVRQTAGSRIVIAGFLVGQQQPGTRVPSLGRAQTPNRIEQDRAGVRREDLRYGELEFAHHVVGHIGLVDALAGGDRFLQRSPLVHGGGGDHAPRVGESLHICEFPGAEFHDCFHCIRADNLVP